LDARLDRRYLALSFAYLIVGGLVAAVAGVFFGVPGVVVCVVAFVLGFAFAYHFFSEQIAELARTSYDREVGSWAVVLGIAGLGLALFPGVVILNLLVLEALFSEATVVGTLVEGCFMFGVGLLVARYVVSSRAMASMSRSLEPTLGPRAGGS
jgi:hypothetical protein